MKWNEKQREAFRAWLVSQEKSPSTIWSYTHYVDLFIAGLPEGELSAAAVQAFRDGQLARGRKPSSVNTALCAVNSYLNYIGRNDCRVRHVKEQNRVFRPRERVILQGEYRRMIQAAKEKKNFRLGLLLETLCAAGLRVSELQFITVEAAIKGEATVSCKRKTRTVFLPQNLCEKLLDYAKKLGRTEGAIFITRTGRPMDRSNIWREMKALSAAAELAPTKVFPHNLRRLFACCFYAQEKDIVKLADLLGHSSIDTTRIYLQTDGEDHRRKIESLGLVS